MSSRSVRSNRAIMPYGPSPSGGGPGEGLAPRVLDAGSSLEAAGSGDRRGRALALLAVLAHGGDRDVVELADLQAGELRAHGLAGASLRRRNREKHPAGTGARCRAVVDAVRHDVG